MPAVVCDSSTWIHLARINQLSLLRTFMAIRAKLTGKIESLRDELERLRNDGGSWIGKYVRWKQ